VRGAGRLVTPWAPAQGKWCVLGGRLGGGRKEGQGRAACIQSADGATGPGLLSRQPWLHDGQRAGAIKRLSHQPTP